MTEHSLSVMTAWGTVVAALAAALAVWAALCQINKTTRIAQQSRTDFKLSLAADLSMKLDDRFNSDEFREARSKAARALLSRNSLGDVEDVFDFFETVGRLVRTTALTEELAYNFFFHWINLYWVAGQSHIQERRKIAKPVWEDFEYVFMIVRQVEASKDADSQLLKLDGDIQLQKTLLREETATSRFRH